MLAAYSTSKHAVIGLSRSAAKDLAPDGIRVNTVHPSPVETRMMRSLEKALPGSPQDAHDRFAANIPLGRYADPEDIADLMLFLASDDAKFITGACHAIDGGSTA
jgi:NAD(P)-dependent dehydrogenase (short-subunit alcohol dehydrogenase family)